MSQTVELGQLLSSTESIQICWLIFYCTWVRYSSQLESTWVKLDSNLQVKLSALVIHNSRKCEEGNDSVEECKAEEEDDIVGCFILKTMEHPSVLGKLQI